ncbi:MAG: DUF1223 domain-containing protein [Gemmobacter sp.]|nr:DUF1223 domain-containing protein [Gemmobacter sp.]
MHNGFTTLFGATAALWVALSGAVAAQGNPVVVELYTSQGCVSCPPADAWLATLADSDTVIALGLHVDYWDYLGWADSFANPAFTARQKRYAKAAGARMIYTPQIIIDGIDRIEGLRPDQISARLKSHAAQTDQVTLTIELKAGVVRILATANPPLAKGAVVQLVRYLPEAMVQIERGENAGRLASHRNIVTAWDRIAEWPGTEALSLDAPAAGDQPVVVIIQEPGPGAILAAARLR